MAGDDLDAILRQCSEVTLPENDVDIRTPPTLQQHLNHFSVKRPTSVFEDAENIYDGVTRFTSGRGRAQRTIYNPGLNDRVSVESDDYLRDSIRKAFPLGYSNEFIEKKWNKQSNQTPSPVLPVDVQFCDIQGEDSESSEKSVSPVKRNVSSPIKSPIKQAAEEKKPPPLSVILGKKNKSDKSEVKEKEVDQKKEEKNKSEVKKVDKKKKEKNKSDKSEVKKVDQKKKEEHGQDVNSNLNPDAPEFKFNFCSSPIKINGTSPTHQRHSPAKSGSDKENGEIARNYIVKHDFYGDCDPYRFFAYDIDEPPFNISSDEDFPALNS
ncbi:uncharacterized protein LOC126883870 [Diabrotica virgifera virgifera]|uniref:Uncharacterized protein LOC114343493 n=1 Tax=Diabrotica virgifera virgifera TaxID=50390 RepID=A0A6P7GXJ1_DIAVI|nr:uncharacterized protein LOC126883870 [Diabrotica virgifera virgifera]